MERRPVAAVSDRPAPDSEPWIGWIEIGRVAAIIAVIAIHVASPLVIRPSHPTSWWFGNIVESASRWCVPIFIMISGALLLSSRKTADAATFYRRRFARLAPAMIVWTIAYLIFGHLTSGTPRDVGEAFRSVIAGRPYFHLYFLFIIAGLYLVAPGLRLLTERLDRRRLAIATAMALGLAMGDSIVQYMGGGGGQNAFTRWVPFVGFFLAGALLLDVERTPGRVRSAIAIVIVAIVATALGTALMVGPLDLGLGRGRYLYEYSSITTVPVSLAAFALLVWFGPGLGRRMSDRLGGLVSSAAAASFGIYLFHPMVLSGLSSLGLDAKTTASPVAVVATVGSAFLISWAIIVGVRRMPVTRAIV